VIGRRALLLGTLGATAVWGAAGCTVVNVTLPWDPPSPLALEAAPDLPGQLARLSALSGHLLDSGKRWKLSERQLSSLDWFRQAVDLHAQVLLSADPARRQRVTTPLPSAAKVTQSSAKATFAALTALLLTMQSEHRARAVAASGPAALLWASLGAFSGTMAARLPSGLPHRGDDDTEQTPDLTSTGRDQVLALCLQAAYSYEFALAAPSLPAADEHALQQRLKAWRGLREQILALTPDATASPPPIGYELRPAKDRAGAFRLAVATETAALPILGTWVGGTSVASERRLGVDALASSNTVLVTFGGTALRWPGWPDG